VVRPGEGTSEDAMALGRALQRVAGVERVVVQDE
jgi:hypothetical protein